MTDGLLNKHELLRAVIDTDWATRLDIRVSSHIIDRYFAKHKNARASLSYLEQATRTDRKNIRDSVRRLTDHHVFWVVREGAGTRPTEYGLNFAFGPSEGTATPSSSGGTATPSSEGTATPTSGPSEGTATPQTHLHDPVTKPGTCMNDDDCPVASPPATGGMAASPGAGQEEDQFEQLWKAYGFRRKKTEARAQFAKLVPQNFEGLLAAATAWREAWEAQGKADAPRHHLHVWLRDERWDEEPPKAYTPNERQRPAPAKQRAGAVPEAANDNGMHVAPKHAPLGRSEAMILDAQPFADADRSDLSILTQAGEETVMLGICIKSSDLREQELGQRMMAQLCEAIGLNQLDQPRQLKNRPFVLEVMPDRTFRFLAA